MVRFTAVAVLVTVFVGCAAPYKPYSRWSQSGFSETQLQPGVWRVRYIGNDANTAEQASDYAFLRASELCLASNQKGLIVMDATEGQDNRGAVMPVTTTASTFGSSSILTALSIVAPTAELSVTCQPEASVDTWDAEFLTKSIKEKYGLQ